MIDPAAQNLGQLIQGLVDCNQVGTLVASQIGGFGAGAITTACNLGLVAGANLIYSKIDGIDGSALEFGLTGTAKALDTNSDRKIDKIQTGTWAGNTSYAGTPAPLAAATFYASGCNNSSTKRVVSPGRRGWMVRAEAMLPRPVCFRTSPNTRQRVGQAASVVAGT